MRAEIVSVGTELLLGTITDTNAPYLAQRLADLGIDCFYVSAVGDNLGRLAEVVRRAFERSDLVVSTGGLGPTGDDLTREAVASVVGEVPYVVPELEADLRAFFVRRSVDMPQQNLKQATLIPSARAITNPVGTAPGWWLETQVHGARRTGIFMPGVPFEMKRMWENEVEPALRGLSGMVLVSRTLKTVGAGESAVEERVADLMNGSNPTLAPYAKSDGIHLRITAKAAGEEIAREMIRELEGKVRERLGDLVYGADGDTPQSAVGDLTRSLGVTIAAVEIGQGAAGAIVPGLSAATALRFGLTATSLADAERVAHAAPGSGLPGILAALAAQFEVDFIVVVISQLTRVNGDATAVRADVEAVVHRTSDQMEFVQRQSWQIPAAEVPRVAGLLTVNQLRRVLMALKAGRESRVVD
jgi:nicotinamide-nucleotide amidase